MEMKKFSLNMSGIEEQPQTIVEQQETVLQMPKTNETHVKLPISKFFMEEFSQFGVYNNYRMLANYEDGLKPSQRKIVYAVQKKNQKNNIKVATLKGEVALMTHYHHGEDNLAGVICGMAANYVGANNINVLAPVGNHGLRCCHEPAADRYIETRKADVFDAVFHPDDTEILQPQYVMEDQIEPVQMAPIVPLILINGSEGMGLGYAQKILPRLPQNIIKAIYAKIDGQPVDPKWFVPGWRGFKGTVTNGENKNQWVISGVWEKNAGRFVGLTVSELPPSYDHETYLQKLDALCEKGDILDYNDKTDIKADRFLFEVKTNRSFMDGNKSEIAQDLSIVQTMTENFTCMNGHNAIQIFEDAQSLFNEWYSKRLKVYDLRLKNLIKKAKDALRRAQVRFDFISDLIEDRYILKGKSYNVTKEEINERYKMPDMTQSLLAIPVSAQTNERLEELLNEIDELEQKLKTLEATTGKQLWKVDLASLEKFVSIEGRKFK